MALPRSLEFVSTLRGFVRDEGGATAVEYGILAGLIGLVVIGALSGLFSKMWGLFNFIGNSI